MHVFAALQEHLLGWSHSAGSCLDPASPDCGVWAWHSTSLFPRWIYWVSSKDKQSLRSDGAEQAALHSLVQPAVLSSLYGQKKEGEKRAQREYQTYDAFLPSCKLGIRFSLESGPSVYPLIQALYCWAGRGKPALSWLRATRNCLV